MSAQWYLTASMTGARGTWPRLASAANAGVSSTSRRMTKATAITAKLRMNGTRQPQALNWPSGM